MSTIERPVLFRRADHRILGGVAGGIAVHLGVRPIAIRIVFLLLTVTGGLGVVIYGAFWIVLPNPPEVVASRRFPYWLEYLVAGTSAVVAIAFVTWRIPLGSLFLPGTLACLGAALIYRQATDTQRAVWLRMSRTSLTAATSYRIGRARLAVGSALVVLGGVVVLARADFTAIRDGLVAVLVTVVGLAILTGPWWMRTVAELSEERRERIRSQERAEIAAKVHDSVLQTLALIQRNAASPREVTRLARGQERELRTLLYGEPSPGQLFAAAIRAIAAEVEDAYGVAVETVIVGDAPGGDRVGALVAAGREALVNAAKHAKVESISLFAEAEDQALTVFVRDRGVGFDPENIDDDRQGVRGSMIGRVERFGGTVTVRSAPGSGTEIEIVMPR